MHIRTSPLAALKPAGSLPRSRLRSAVAGPKWLISTFRRPVPQSAARCLATICTGVSTGQAVLRISLGLVWGHCKHWIVDWPVCAADLACFGLEHLFQNGLVARDGFDALVVVTQSPDYFMLPTSSVIQGRLGLKQDMFCMDINQGCAGFVIG